MTVASRMFNSSTLTFSGTAVTKIVGISYKHGGQWVDVTQPEDANKLYELATQGDLAVSVKFKGGNSMVPNTKGTLAIVWKDGSTTSCPGTWMVGPTETTGDWDAPITGSTELRPTVPDGA